MTSEPWITFPCSCGTQVPIHTTIMPGQAVVVVCENCELSWTVYQPSLVIRETKKLPESMQTAIWGKIANEAS